MKTAHLGGERSAANLPILLDPDLIFSILCMVAMELKLEPLESTLRASWALQAWRRSSGQDNCRPAPPMEDTSASPQIAAEASHTSNGILPEVESTRLNGYDEGTNLSISAAKLEERASVTPEPSFHSSDGVQSGVDSSQADGSGSVTNQTSAPETTPDVPDQRQMSDEAFIPGSAQSTGLIPVGALEKGTVSEYGMLGQAVELLEQNCWIYTRYDGDSPNIRVHVNSRMAHGDNSQRSVSKLRDALKLLMAKIDCTFEAWTGRMRAASPDVVMSNGVDDESLWYIFNTLQDPNPQVDLVQDEWSRKAMQYLLSDEDLSDLGLKTRLYPYQRRSAAMMVQREAQPARMLDPRLQACQSPEGLEYYYDKQDGFVTLQKDMYDEAVGGTSPVPCLLPLLNSSMATMLELLTLGRHLSRDHGLR